MSGSKSDSVSQDTVDEGDGRAARAGGGLVREGHRTPAEVLDEVANIGPKSVGPEESRQDCSSESARELVERYCAEHVDDLVIVSSRQIANQMGSEIRPQEIGKALGCRRAGATQDDFLDDIEIGRWGTGTPVKWELTRVDGGEDRTADTISRPGFKPDIVAEIDAELDVEDGVSYYDCGDAHNRIRIHRAWMIAALEAVCDAVGSDVEIEYDELAKAGATKILGRVLEIDTPGAADSWSKPTLECIYDVLVVGITDVDEVGR